MSKKSMPTFGTWHFSVFCLISKYWHTKSRCFPFLDISTLPSIDAVRVCVSNFPSESGGHPRIRRCYRSAGGEPVCCEKHLASSSSVSLSKKNMWRLSFPLDVKGKGREQDQGRNERKTANCQWVGGSRGCSEEHLTTEDTRLRLRLLCAPPTCH